MLRSGLQANVENPSEYIATPAGVKLLVACPGGYIYTLYIPDIPPSRRRHGPCKTHITTYICIHMVPNLSTTYLHITALPFPGKQEVLSFGMSKVYEDKAERTLLLRIILLSLSWTVIVAPISRS